MTTPATLQKLDNARDLCKQAAKKSGNAQIEAQANALIAVSKLNLTNAGEFRGLLGLDQPLFALCLSVARHPYMPVSNPSPIVSRVISLARAGEQ